MSRKKRGQSEIITTVLIILLVLVAVFIVWTAVKGIINKSTENLGIKSELIGADTTVISASATTVVLRRESGGSATEVAPIVLVNGAIVEADCNPGKIAQFETTECSLTDSLKEGDNVTAGLKMGESTYGAFSREFSVGGSVTPPGSCVYEDWVDASCGGGCLVNQMRQTKGVISGSGCTDTTRCVSDSLFCQTISGAVSYWNLDGNTDDSVGENDGTLVTTGTGTAEITSSGRFGSGLSLISTGTYSDGYLNLGSPTNLNFGVGQDFSISLWFKSVNTGYTGNLIFKKNGDEEVSQGYSIKYYYGDTVRFVIGNGASAYGVTNVPTTRNDGNWHHYVAVKNNFGVYVYQDLVEYETLADLSSFDTSASTTLYFGIGDYGTNGWSGVVDEVAIFDRSLTPAEIQTLYNG